MVKAYSYLRFSTPEQMQGDSFRRQSSLAAEYAAKHGLELDTELTFQDLGVSAYRAKNAEAGRLADFLEAVENKVVPQGSYLLVESLDRVSRTTPRKAVRILERICEAGVNVVTLSDGKVYNEDNLDNDGGMSLIMSVLIFIRANEESAMKSRRIKASWEARREEARKTGKPVPGKTPGWLKRDPETGDYILIDEKVAIIRRLFAMAANGYGLVRIAKMLNDEGVPTISSGKRWYHTTVRHFIENRGVLGEYTPGVIEYVNGKKTSKPAGEPARIYPPIISEALFNSVQDTREKLYGDRIEAGRLRRGHKVVNIFSGLSICSRCGNSMTMQHKGGGVGKSYRYLVCTNARYGKGCKYTAIELDTVTERFLEEAFRILASPPSPSRETEEEMERIRGAMEGVEESIANVITGIERAPDPALSQRLGELRGDLTVLQEREKALLSIMASTSGPTVERRIEALRGALLLTERDNKRINGCLQALFTGMSLNPDTGIATLAWRGGGTSEFPFRMPEAAHLAELAEARNANLALHRAKGSKAGVEARRAKALRKAPSRPQEPRSLSRTSGIPKVPIVAPVPSWRVT